MAVSRSSARGAEPTKGENAATEQTNLTTTDIFLYIPNLIGYSRVIFAFVSLFFMPWHPKVCTWFYCVSCVLDALDGAAARKFNQTSRFGAILDMVTDRCTTSSLICYLCIAYPKFAIFFQLLISLDLASHYMHMYASLAVGAGSHKKVGEDSWLLHLYYTNTKVLFIVCAANELFFIGLYLSNFALQSPPHLGYTSFGGLVGLFGIADQVPLSYATLICIFTFPLWALKQFLNVVQLSRAAITLAQADVEEKTAAKKTQ